MKYKLIHCKTKEEVLCDKVIVDAFDYYITNDSIIDYYYNEVTNVVFIETHIKRLEVINKRNKNNRLKIVASNNPNYDTSQVIDEVDKLAENYLLFSVERQQFGNELSFIDGYKKSQERHPFNKEDMLDLIQELKDYTQESHTILGHDERDPKEFFNTWKENRNAKIIYYE